MAGERQHAGVLAGAVVVHRLGRPAGGEQAFGRRRMQRRMRAAGQRVRGDADPAEPAAHAGHVHRLAAVRGAGQRELGLGQPEAARGPALQQGQRLQRLDRRARKHRSQAAPAACCRRPPASATA